MKWSAGTADRIGDCRIPFGTRQLQFKANTGIAAFDVDQRR